MTPLPPATTLVISGARVMLPDGDWHDPAVADIAIAADRIAGVAPHYANLPDAPPGYHGRRGGDLRGGRRRNSVTSPPSASTAEYSGANSDIIRARLTAQRNAELCAGLPRKVEGWIGWLTELSLIGTGEAMLTVNLDGKVSVRTWNNMVSDVVDHSTVPPNTPLASKLETMKTGSVVRFDGRFIPNGKSCHGGGGRRGWVDQHGGGMIN